MTALRWTLVSLLLVLGALTTCWMILMLFGYGVTGTFPWVEKSFPVFSFFVKWCPIGYPILALSVLSFNFLGLKRWPNWTIVALTLALLLAAAYVGMSAYVIYKDPHGKWHPFKPLPSDYVCTHNKVVRVDWYGYGYYYYTPKMTTMSNISDYQALQKRLGKLLLQCKNAKGQSIPKTLPAKPVPSKSH
ncbi:MAG: hypothetical protein P1U40_05520 [Coxiellaceae bacterium]|nr:hypothetical protein [Coxiellaceae bacterium]